MSIRRSELEKLFGKEMGLAAFVVLITPNDKLIEHAELMGCADANLYHDPDERRLTMLNFAIDGFGVEAILDDSGIHPVLSYVNLGETYATTLCFEHETSDYLLLSWGEWHEQNIPYSDEEGL